MKSLNVDGYIVPDEDVWFYDFCGMQSVSPGKLRAFLSESAGEDIEIRVGTCYGGDVWSASDMYSQLRDYKGASSAVITALSASACTFMMLGCKTVSAVPTAQMMIHCASSYAEGNHIDMEEAAQRLRTADDSILNAYMLKTKKDRAELEGLMEKSTWFSAGDMLSMGFIDSIELKDDEKLSDLQINAVASLARRAYASVGIDPSKMHEMALRMKQNPAEEPKKEDPETDEWQDRASAQLEIEKMRF